MATCEPKTPRHTCASSTTTKERRKKKRQVQHVRIRHHQVRVLADQRPLGARRVAVVHGSLHLRDRERTDRPELIARERLRREQVERGRRRPLHGLRCERQVVDERLAARRPCGHDQVATVGQHLEPRGLMRIQPADADQLQPVLHQRRDPRGERLDRRAASGQLSDVDQRRRRGFIRGQRGKERPRVHVRDATGCPRNRGRVVVDE